MKRQKFVYNAHAGDNTNFVYKELGEMANLYNLTFSVV